MRHYFTSTRMATLKITSVGENTEKLKSLCSVGGNENGVVTAENSTAVLQKIKPRVTI